MTYEEAGGEIMREIDECEFAWKKKLAKV